MSAREQYFCADRKLKAAEAKMRKTHAKVRELLTANATVEAIKKATDAWEAARIARDSREVEIAAAWKAGAR